MNQAQRLFRDEAIEWSVLAGALDADSCLPFGDHAGRRRSAEVYAQLARSFASTAFDLQVIAGDGASSAANTDALHASARRTRDELELEVARNRALGARWRLLTIAALTPRSCWSAAFVETFRRGTIGVYSNRLAELAGAASFVAEPS
jgi:hypothetical protein